MASVKGIYGIDLGTTNSCVALVNEATGKPEVKPNFEGKPITPSVVYFEKNAPEPVIGEEARRWARLAPSLVCSEVKRHMGSDAWRFKVRERADGYRPEAISGFILRKILRDALQHDEIKPDGDVPAVISVPAYFGDVERRATRAAGQAAGIDVQDIVVEPVAAAFAYGFGRVEVPQNLLVYDLGGGTFDVTVVRVDGSSAHTVATEGVRILGGMDWDKEIVSYVCQEIQEKNGVDLSGEVLEKNPMLKQQLYEEAEKAKIALSATAKTSIAVHFEGKSFSVELSLERFNEITKGLLDRTVDKTREAIAAAEKNGVRKIDKLLLVGGSSRMKAVKERLLQDLKLEGQLHDPDQAIAKGAALVGHLIRQGKYTPNTTGKEGVAPPSVITSVNSKSLGIVVERAQTKVRFVDYLIPRNSKLPVNETKQYYTVDDNQTGLDLQVMEQRQEPSENPEENTVIHQKSLIFPNPLPKESPLIVTYALDSQALLHIRIKEPKSGKEFEERVSRAGMISESEIRALKSEIAKA